MGRGSCRSGTTNVAIMYGPEPRSTAVPSAGLSRIIGAIRLRPALARHSRVTQTRVAARSMGSPVSRDQAGQLPSVVIQDVPPEGFGTRRDRLEIAGDRPGSCDGDRPVPRVGNRDPASIGGLRLAVGPPRERDAGAQQAPKEPIASLATPRMAIPLDLHGHGASRQERPRPALQVRPEQGLGPVGGGLATVDHSQSKSLPPLADGAVFSEDFQVVDQEIVLLGPLPGPDEIRAGPVPRLDREPIHADGQDGGLGYACLHRVDRGIPRGGVAECQRRREVAMEPVGWIVADDLGLARRSIRDDDNH